MPLQLPQNLDRFAVAEAVQHSLSLPKGLALQCGNRAVRVEKVHDNGQLELRDTITDTLMQVQDRETGTLAPPTISWLRQAYRAGDVYSLEPRAETAAGRSQRLTLLDPDLCGFFDAKSTWRFFLACEALDAGLIQTDEQVGLWLDENYDQLALDFAQHKSQFAIELRGDVSFRPSPSTLRNWIRTIKNGVKRPGALVSKAGRRKGRSQLDPRVDAEVHRAALLYWSETNMTVEGAYTDLRGAIQALNVRLLASGERTSALPVPSKETLRKRIAGLSCEDTVKSKFGARAARARFNASGEPLHADRILEIALMDATGLEQVTVLTDDHAIPAFKTTITVLADVASHAIIGWHIFAGPVRIETSTEAIISCMIPKGYEQEMLTKYPGLADIFGRPASILPDNERGLIGPSSLPALNEIGITLQLPPVEMPTAKSGIERFFSTLKTQLKEIPGTVIDQKVAKNFDYDPLASAVCTIEELRMIVAQVVASYNVSATDGLNGFSPLQIWQKKIHTRLTPPFENIEELRRRLGRTVKVNLSKDGVELDGIKYRHPIKVRVLLDHLAHTGEPRNRRKDGSLSIEVIARRADSNIDTIDIFDPTTRQYVTLPSNQPQYTDRLTFWEHTYFRKAAKFRREPFEAEEARLASRAVTVGLMHKLFPAIAFQQRAKMAVLQTSKTVDLLSGGSQPIMPEHSAGSIPSVLGSEHRKDNGLPPDIPFRKGKLSVGDASRKSAHPAGAYSEMFNWDQIPSADFSDEESDFADPTSDETTDQMLD